MESVQLSLSLKYLIRLIEDSVYPSNANRKRQAVSQATLDHPFIAALVSGLAGISPRQGDRGASPGQVYWDTVGEGGFSLKVYSLKGGDRQIALMSRSSGRDAVQFQARRKYESYLDHKRSAVSEWCQYIEDVLGLPIHALEERSTLAVQMDRIQPHLPELLRLIRALA